MGGQGYFAQRQMRQQQNALLQQQQAQQQLEDARKAQEKSQTQGNQPVQSLASQAAKPNVGIPTSPLNAPKVPSVLKPSVLPGQGSVPATSMGQMPKWAFDVGMFGANLVNPQYNRADQWWNKHILDPAGRAVEPAYDWVRGAAGLSRIAEPAGVATDAIRDFSNPANDSKSWSQWAYDRATGAWKDYVEGSIPFQIADYVAPDTSQYMKNTFDVGVRKMRPSGGSTMATPISNSTQGPKPNGSPAGPTIQPPEAPRPTPAPVFDPGDWSNAPESSWLKPYTKTAEGMAYLAKIARR